MLPGELQSSEIMAWTSTVLVNGQVRKHKSWSVGRAIEGQMPEQVVAGGGIAQAEGSITWDLPKVITDLALNPWNSAAGWIPSPGDRVEIWSGDGSTSWRQFTGIADKTSGSMGSGVSTTIIDDFDRLGARYSHDALLRVMPPRVNGDPLRGVCLNPTYFIDGALRAAGFNATPPLENRPALSVPAQGSMWPERGGVLQASAAAGSSESHAQFYAAPWGYVAGNFLVEYAPNVALTPDEPVESSVLVAATHSGNYFQTKYYGSTAVQLAVSASRTVIARLNGVEVCRITLTSSERTVGLLVKAGTWTLRTDTGRTATGSAATPTSPEMSKIILSGDEATRIAGVQVCYPATSTEFRPVGYTPTAVIEVGNTAFLSLIDASPVIEPTESRDLLDEISKATLTAMWIDESGVFRAVPADELRKRDVVKTYTTSIGIQALSWSDSLLALRRGVDHDYQRPIIDLRPNCSKILYQGSAQTLGSGESSIELIGPTADEHWIEPDLTFEILGDVGSATNSNRGRGSITGAILTDGETEMPGGDYLTASLEQIVPGTYKLTQKAGTLPTGFDMETRYPSESLTIRKQWLGEAFPFVRGFAGFGLVKVTRTSPITGPVMAPSLVHDSAFWLARETNTIVVDRVLEHIAIAVTSPSPTITSLRVAYDPRLQLGDVILVDSPKLMGIRLRCLIVSKQDSADGSYTQELGVVIIEAENLTMTFEQFNAESGVKLTFAQWNALTPTTQTFTQFNTDS